MWRGGEEGHLKWTRGEEVSGSCCNLHKATHFLISSTTFIPNSSTSVNIATLQVLPKKQNKNHFCSDWSLTTRCLALLDNVTDPYLPDWPELIIRKCHSTSISLLQSYVYFIWIQLVKIFSEESRGYSCILWAIKSAVHVCFPQSIEIGHQRRKS